MTFRVNDLVGRDLAGFRLTDLLGEGGMAVVYRGENNLNRAIVRAIKVVRPELVDRPEFVRRFATEAELLERLRHPNIVAFFGLRETELTGERVLFMELELLDGMALSDANREPARQGGASVAWAVSCIARAADGVAAAHDAGVVHRDLKPDNIFLCRNGDVKVLDFGIAKVVDEEDRRTKLTAIGTVAGTVAYLAPEVCNGAVPDARADVYALGVSLVELLLGHHPYQPPGAPQRSSAQLMLAHVSHPMPRVRDLRNDVSPKLAAVLEKATAKQPDQRYPSARDLSSALRALAPDLPALAASAPRTKLETEFAVPVLSGSVTTDVGRSTANSPSPGSGTRVRWTWKATASLAAIAAFAIGTLAYRTFGNSSSPNASPHRDAGVVSNHDSATRSPTAAPAENAWIRVDGATQREERYYYNNFAGYRTRTVIPRLGVAENRTAAENTGFRPERNITAPTVPFVIQQHEVTWSELEPFLALPEHSALSFTHPSSVPNEASARARLPAIGVPWNTARAFCASIGGNLPTEEQWEYAGRGQELRPYPWGTEPIDLARTHVFQGESATVAPVMENDQDATPNRIFDLLGNAQEWTLNIYRDDNADQDESWAQQGGVTFRSVRGVPHVGDAPPNMPTVGLAVRDALCATGACSEGTDVVLARVGFRCVRSVDG